MSYRVMLVDDEESIRTLMRKSIDWAGLNMEICGEAANGIEAINTIDEMKPQILIVDIRMPFMDGIEFSKIALKRYQKVKIIILTAFDDFEYARACIGLGICDYLLKPVVRKELTESLRKVKIQLDQSGADAEEGDNPDLSGSMIERIKTYLQQNYTSADMNLTKAAQEFNFNPSYFSRRFKAETGESFTDFLTRCRMEKAIELAGKGKLMYQTAREVGIPDPNYFGKCFKKYTGKTYSAFLEKS